MCERLYVCVTSDQYCWLNYLGELMQLMHIQKFEQLLSIKIYAILK